MWHPCRRPSAGEEDSCVFARFLFRQAKLNREMTENKEKLPEEKARLKARRKRFILWGMIMVVVAFLASYYVRLDKRFIGPVAWVYIPKDATPEAVRDSLVKSLGKDFGGRVYDLWNGNLAMGHGAYRVQPEEPAWRVARMISSTAQTPIRLTFNNIRTFDNLANVFGDIMEFTPEEFKAAADSISKADSIPMEMMPALFLPDTYEVYWSDSPAKIIAKIRKNFNRFWNEERLARAHEMGFTPYEISILASIVEEESNRHNEHETIARLYLNRLQRGMLLQADPTVKFACGDFAARRITAEMLKTDSPYNTYKYAGLPPGPIRLPEPSTIDDVLKAPENDFIYMCARPDFSGFHDFTSDYSIHLKNAANYRKALNEKGIK